MPKAAVYRGVEGAYLDLLRLATEDFERHIDAPGNPAREVTGASFRLTNPRQRLPFLRAREVNPVAQVAEALWHLAGRRDLEMINYYAPSRGLRSTGGVALNGSAYGLPLLPDGDSRAPFDDVLKLLRGERDSQRGYLPVISAQGATDQAHPDVACLASLHLLPRAGRLHMVCTMRATDLDRDLLADVFSFTMIQEFAAVQLGLRLGTYTHVIGTAHVSDRDADRVRRVLNEAATEWETTYPFPVMPQDTTAGTIRLVMEHEEALRLNEIRYSAEHITRLNLPPYWRQIVALFEAYRQIRHGNEAPVVPDLLDLLDPGMCWLLRCKWPARTENAAEAAAAR